jgi:branched-chain amino acid transport system ATP-binding protein
VLELTQVSRHFGGVRAVDQLSLKVEAGQIFGLIGPNGSGKSTTVNLVTGLFPLTSGAIRFRGADLAPVPVHKRLALGIARTFQNIRLFGHLTVWQNLWVAQNSPEDHAKRGFLARWLGGSRGVRAEIGELLEFSGLAHRQDELASNLAFGEQRRLELARALAPHPGDPRPRRHRAPDRAPHGASDGRDRPPRGAELRPEDRRGHAGRGAGRPCGPEGLSGRGAVMAAVLEIADLVTAYGKIEALKGVSLSVAQGSITCLLGPNGAGKTTLMLTTTGILRPRRGSIRFGGQEIAGRAPHDVVARGIALVPENRLVFPSMTVAENLAAGAYQRDDKAGIAEDVERLFGRFPRLKERAQQQAGTLSGGEQQMLAVARALMSRPKLLLMDEPSLGLAPLVVEEIFRIVAELNRDGTTIFLVEQNAHMALQVAHHFYLMEQGRVTFSGTPGQVAEDEVIRRAYLGSAKR